MTNDLYSRVVGFFALSGTSTIAPYWRVLSAHSLGGANAVLAENVFRRWGGRVAPDDIFPRAGLVAGFGFGLQLRSGAPNSLERKHRYLAVMLRLYHRTTEIGASTILSQGFRDATDYYLTDQLRSGVWLSNIPLDASEGTKGQVLLEVNLELSEADLGEFEWVEEDKPYREWLVPASFVNPHMSVRIVPEDEEADMPDPRFAPAPLEDGNSSTCL